MTRVLQILLLQLLFIYFLLPVLSYNSYYNHGTSATTRTTSTLTSAVTTNITTMILTLSAVFAKLWVIYCKNVQNQHARFAVGSQIMVLSHLTCWKNNIYLCNKTWLYYCCRYYYECCQPAFSKRTSQLVQTSSLSSANQRAGSWPPCSSVFQVWVLDYFGGVKTVTPEEYFQAAPHRKHH